MNKDLFSLIMYKEKSHGTINHISQMPNRTWGRFLLVRSSKFETPLHLSFITHSDLHITDQELFEATLEKLSFQYKKSIRQVPEQIGDLYFIQAYGVFKFQDDLFQIKESPFYYYSQNELNENLFSNIQHVNPQYKYSFKIVDELD